MTPYYADDSVTVYHGDNREVLAVLPGESIDACVTDPPYELAFMGRRWDATGIAYDVDLWREVMRVLKPGGHLLAFGGTRTWHRLAVAIEDAGFEVRDSIAWMYGSGFPKSLDVSKAIDKAAGAEREVVGKAQRVDGKPRNYDQWSAHQTDSMAGTLAVAGPDITAPATPAAQQWQGWGTALKPAFEPVVVARKPLIGTVAENVLTHGTGALNVDGCRIGTQTLPAQSRGVSRIGTFEGADGNITDERTGRWPANVILDESQAAELDRQSGPVGSNSTALGRSDGTRSGASDIFRKPDDYVIGRSGYDTRADGGASRFFYVPKANSSERPRAGEVAHPTVKPLELMRYLVRLVTPPGGTVLEPFAGSGTTAEACVVEGFRCIAVERESDYLPLILQRITKPIEVTLL